MLSDLWTGVLVGVIGAILPSLVVLAVLIKRAPEIKHHLDEGEPETVFDLTAKTNPRHGG